MVYEWCCHCPGSVATVSSVWLSSERLKDGHQIWYTCVPGDWCGYDFRSETTTLQSFEMGGEGQHGFALCDSPSKYTDEFGANSLPVSNVGANLCWQSIRNITKAIPQSPPPHSVVHSTTEARPRVIVNVRQGKSTTGAKAAVVLNRKQRRKCCRAPWWLLSPRIHFATLRSLSDNHNIATSINRTLKRKQFEKY